MKAEITLASKAVPQANLMSNQLSDADVGLAPQENTISATLKNNDDNIIVKKVHMEANFYNKPKGLDGSFNPANLKGSLYWDFDQEITTGDAETVTGTFGVKGPPSPFYSAHAEATVVLPHSGVARTNTLKETP